ncbi:hypothetical protein HUE87_12020 [Candidatus Sulfurimonas marisnigri]|uniref:Uncharacterized protein n=1 Tax=Candidatus Sulfurimonas marisnigri TaxID=2740405 RepID=A0A7S7RQK7_9BACT|nr:hypothetical protein [Candidatus Sulfurimonas marisnigri]QOY54570.1 hypothetical protein HUE87_12020 [Candidatus Sulfurimonas marisnigri]
MITSLALSLLLGFELSYYLLIVQTGVVAYYNSDLIILFPMFVGGIFGTILSGRSWGKIDNPIYKIMIALALQLLLSLTYPEYNIFTLGLLGLAVGLMAPLGIYLFKVKQSNQLLLALAIAYISGTYFYTSDVDGRLLLAIIFSFVALISAILLKNYKVDTDAKLLSLSFVSYAPLILWILLDSTLFETLSRHNELDIWSNHTLMIGIFHVVGLLAAYLITVTKKKQHIIIAVLFFGSYSLFYLKMPLMLAMLYPFTISYYNVTVFRALSKEMSLPKLAFIMVFVGWIASGLGLSLALFRLLY